MAKSALTWEGRRALTDNFKSDAGKYKEAAKELLDLGLLSESASFFIKAEDNESLNLILDQTVSEGNLFVYKQVIAYLGLKTAKRSSLEKLIAAAEKAGLNLYAEHGRQYLAENFN